MRVVESESMASPVGHPFGCGGVIASNRGRRDGQLSQKDRAHRMATRVARRVRVNADKLKIADLDAGLLAHLAATSGL